jgi:AraC-like DNA-binding protein
MIYLQTRTSPPLSGFIRALWYAKAHDIPHQRERVLPDGCAQVILSLAADKLTHCENGTNVCHTLPPALLVGARGRYEIIHTRDMAELVGIVFRPGGLGPWLRHPADDFFERSIPLDDLLDAKLLRDLLLEQPSPACKLAALDSFLCERLHGRTIERRPMVQAALFELRRRSVRQTSITLGVSERRLHQVFNQDAGLSPKLWSRVYRFQRAVHSLHTGIDLRWEQLALDCGYYDQSHFSNDFRAFSGIDPTTYSAHRGPWRNHVAIA